MSNDLKEKDSFLSRNFTLSEFTHSATAMERGICNEPPIEAISNLQNLCQEVLQPLREHYGKAIHISSGYRCKELNSLVGGVENSQHLKGEAADLVLPSLATGLEWCNWVKTHLKNYDQLILERNEEGKFWIHVSAKRELYLNRHMSFFKLKPRG